MQMLVKCGLCLEQTVISEFPLDCPNECGSLDYSLITDAPSGVILIWEIEDIEKSEAWKRE